MLFKAFNFKNIRASLDTCIIIFSGILKYSPLYQFLLLFLNGLCNFIFDYQITHIPTYCMENTENHRGKNTHDLTLQRFNWEVYPFSLSSCLSLPYLPLLYNCSIAYFCFFKNNLTLYILFWISLFLIDKSIINIFPCY